MVPGALAELEDSLLSGNAGSPNR